MITRLYVKCFASEQNEKIKNWEAGSRECVGEIDFESDFASVIVGARKSELDVLIIDYADFAKNREAMQIFGVGTIFCVPNVIIAGGNSVTNSDLPKNYVSLGYDEIPQFLVTLRAKLVMQQSAWGGANSCHSAEILQTTHQTLLDLGFKGSTMGTNFIAECILGVIEINCSPSALNRTIYADIVARHNATIENVMRCTRSALETTWRRRDKNTPRLANGVCFGDFKLCPSLKEFIYYVARKISTYLNLPLS